MTSHKKEIIEKQLTRQDRSKGSYTSYKRKYFIEDDSFTNASFDLKANKRVKNAQTLFLPHFMTSDASRFCSFSALILT